MFVLFYFNLNEQNYNTLRKNNSEINYGALHINLFSRYRKGLSFRHSIQKNCSSKFVHQFYFSVVYIK